MSYSEFIYIEGGPDFTGMNGRGDFELLKPIDHITMYPDGPCTYNRTNRTWTSPRGHIHTVFEFVGRVKDDESC